MAKIPRHCSRELLDLVASNQQAFDVQAGRVELQEGDLLEFDDQQGHQVVRRVDSILYSRDLLHEGEEDQGVTVVGLSRGTVGPLGTAFGGNGIAVGFALERHQGKTDVATPPQYLPALVCPPIELDVVLEQLQVDHWPDGVFSILLSARVPPRPEAGRLSVEVRETLVLALTRQQDVDVFIEVDQRLLRIGKLQDGYGKDLDPYFGQEDDDAAGPRAGLDAEAPLDYFEKGDDPGGVE